MKQFKVWFLTTILFTLVFSFSSCKEETIVDKADASSTTFDFKTIKDVDVSITTLSYSDEPMAGVYVEIYTQNPYDESGAFKPNSTDYLMQKGQTDNSGVLTCKIAPATTVDSLVVIVNHAGLQDYHAIKLSSNDIKLTIGGKAASNVKQKVGVAAMAKPTSLKLVEGFAVLGDWNKAGVPDYLVANDIINAKLMKDIDMTLPEKVKITNLHPEYLTSADNGKIDLNKPAEVWVTFVHEGATYLNTLTYYAHKSVQAAAVDVVKTVIFPNASYSGSGGGLQSGNKVQLFYYDQITKTYSNIFPAGTTVSWMLRANGFSGSKLGAGNNDFFSNALWNKETDPKYKKHNVILKDESRQLFLMGFEDLQRGPGGNSDEDFNDGIYLVKVVPYDAVDLTLYKPIDTSFKDQDEDGVSDDKDEFPTDSKKAFTKRYPSLNNFGTLAFEDLWPSKGDFDFNDLVVDYNFEQVTNALNQTIELNVKLVVKAIGANYKNGFGIELNTPADNVLSVTGQNTNDGIVKLNANGTEKGQGKAVIIAFDNAFKVTPLPGFGSTSFTNTTSGGSYSTPGEVNLKIVFKNPVSASQLGTEPFNPFIFINGERGKEVHLPTKTPTSLADQTLFGTKQDGTNLALGMYYVSPKYLPWAINFPVQFNYPTEKNDIGSAFKYFNMWVESKGATNMDWYMDKPDYRFPNLIYTK